MHLSSAQVDEFRRRGFLLIPNVFSTAEIGKIAAELPGILRTTGAAAIREKGSNLVRSVYGSHRSHEICDQMTRHPRLLLPAMQLLDGPAYVHQFKINAKAAFGGDQWEWHQDYIFWRNEDGMPSARVINVAVYLDDVTDFNGPMFLLPGSHREGVIEPAAAGDPAPAAEAEPGQASSSPAWLSHLTTGLKYALEVDTMKALVSRWGLYSAKAGAGAVLIFDANLVHGSAPNMSPFDRAVAIVTFNSTANVLPPSARPRPEFLAGRDFTPLAPVAEDVWTREAVTSWAVR